MASYKEWVNLIDIDYYTAFLKSWIAFNSWYKSRPEYESFVQDRQIIDEIKNKSNSLFKTNIINLITGNDFESKSFQQDIGNLHISLSQAAIYIHNGNNPHESISFEKIATSNQTKTQSKAMNGFKYNVERIKGGKVKSEIKKADNTIIFRLEQEAYNDLALETSSDFDNLSDGQQKNCLMQLYRNVNPYTYYSIIHRNKKDKKFKLGEVTFIGDTEKISISIIEILFMLRNSLIHGNVEPNENNSKVYKFAYSLLYTVLKKMR